MADTSRAGAPPGQASGGWFAHARARLPAWLGECAAADAGRLALWTPVAVGCGVAAYFSLKSEPPAWLDPVLLACAAVSWMRAGRTPRGAAALRALALVLIGFAAADLRQTAVDAPVLSRDLRYVEVTGRLAEVETGPSRRRLTLDLDSIGGLAAAQTPARARVTWRGKAFNVAPGDRVRLRAVLQPPPEPVAPGAYDFARDLYFQRIGAVGYAVSAPEKIAGPAPPIGARIAAAVDRARVTLAARVMAAAPGPGGAVAAALVTGEREQIPKAAEDALRDSGLAHLLAISGLHMGLVAGILFFTIRGLLALWERVALTRPVKKWAAGAALLGAAGYLALSGAGWSAQRAFIMTAIVFAAVLADRQAFTLRNVAVAATALLLVTPEALLHAGFQMSFAAVTALVAFYEWLRARTAHDVVERPNAPVRIVRYVLALAATSLIAGWATGAFAMFHFNRLALWGLPANLAAMPVMAFWIMPAAVLGVALSPFGLDAPAWTLTATGVDVVIRVADTVSHAPHAVAHVASFPVAALALAVLGGLWLCLNRARWRVLGFVGLVLGAVLAQTGRPPDVFVDRDARNVAIRAAAPQEAGSVGAPYAVLSARRSKFAVNAWLRSAGLDPESRPPTFSGAGACDAAGCVVRAAAGQVVAVSEDPSGLDQDCARADLVIALYGTPAWRERACAAALIDAQAVRNEGAAAAWLSPDGGVRIETANTRRGRRPWVRRTRKNAP